MQKSLIFKYIKKITRVTPVFNSVRTTLSKLARIEESPPLKTNYQPERKVTCTTTKQKFGTYE